MAGDGRVPYESGGAEGKPFRPEINEDAQTASQEAGRNNSTGVRDEGGNSTSISAATRIAKRQQSWKQKIFITRSEIQHPMTMESLPDDLLLNIFIRLLAKQLAQMRCVSKSWKALLSESSFIKSHLHRSINNNDQMLMVFYAETSFSDPKSFTAYPFQSTHLELANFFKLPPVNPNSGGVIRVIGSVHGLICSSYGDDVIHIWNPSLSAFLTLPPHHIPIPSSGRRAFFRFGFDPKTEDYKVVKLIGLTGTSLVKEWLQVEVYSMKKGSWELVSQRIPSHVIMLANCDVICVDGHDGHLHWVAHIGEKGDRQTIVAFDLSSGTFREIPFPDSVLDATCFMLGVSGGKLCVLSLYEDEGDRYEVWVMEEYGVVESWVKRHAFLHFASDVEPVGFTSHNELLLIDHNNNLGLYDPVAHKAKFLEKLGLGNYTAVKAVEYVDSLVWVAPQMVDGGRQN